MGNQDISEENIKFQLEEARDSWDREWQRNSILEGKATSIIQISGTITTLIFGFVTFAQGTTKLVLPSTVQYMIIISVVFSILSIIASINVFWVRQYPFPVEPKKYLKNQNVKLDINSVYTQPHDKLLDIEKLSKRIVSATDLIAHYMLLIEVFRIRNQDKANAVRLSTVFLIISIILTGLAVLAIFSSQPSPLPIKNQIACTELKTIKTNDSKVFDTRGKTDSTLLLCIRNSDDK